MCKCLGVIQLFYDGDEIIFSSRGIELGRGATVRKAIEAGYKYLTKTLVAEHRAGQKGLWE